MTPSLSPSLIRPLMGAVLGALTLFAATPCAAQTEPAKAAKAMEAERSAAKIQEALARLEALQKALADTQAELRSLVPAATGASRVELRDLFRGRARLHEGKMVVEAIEEDAPDQQARGEFERARRFLELARTQAEHRALVADGTGAKRAELRDIFRASARSREGQPVEVVDEAIEEDVPAKQARGAIARARTHLHKVELQEALGRTPTVKDLVDDVRRRGVVDIERLRLENAELRAALVAARAKQRSNEGAIGNILSDPDLADGLNRTLRGVRDMVEKLPSSEGLTGKLLRDPDSHEGLARAMREARAVAGSRGREEGQRAVVEKVESVRKALAEVRESPATRWRVGLKADSAKADDAGASVAAEARTADADASANAAIDEMRQELQDLRRIVRQLTERIEQRQKARDR